MQTDGTRYTILALAPFDPDPLSSGREDPLAVRRDTLDECLAALPIHYLLPLDADLCPAGGIDLTFDSFKALHPDQMVKQNPYLHRLYEAAAFLELARKGGQAPEQIVQGLRRWPELPRVTLPVMPDKSAAPSRPPPDTVDQILQMVAMPASTPAAAPPNPLLDLPRRILNALFSRPDFRRTEAAWRGLHLLLAQGAVDDAVRIEFAHLDPESPGTTLDRLSARIQADPPALIVLDHPFDNTPLSTQRLRELTHLADTWMVPVMAWVSSEFLEIDSWAELGRLPYLPSHLDGAAYAKFRTLRQSPQSPWLSLACNRFLVRYPYGPQNPLRKASLTESTPPWIAPVWGIAALIAQSVCRTGWPTRFTERGTFQLQDLALTSGDRTPPLVVEFCPDAERRRQLLKIGLTPLSTETGRDRAFCSSAVTLAGGSLNHQLLVSQVAQFLGWCREHLPVDGTAADLEFQLRLAFQVFSERSRPPGLAEVHVAVRAPNEEGRLPVRIAVTPAAHVLQGEAPIEMEIHW